MFDRFSCCACQTDDQQAGRERSYPAAQLLLPHSLLCLKCCCSSPYVESNSLGRLLSSEQLILWSTITCEAQGPRKRSPRLQQGHVARYARRHDHPLVKQKKSFFILISIHRVLTRIRALYRLMVFCGAPYRVLANTSLHCRIWPSVGATGETYAYSLCRNHNTAATQCRHVRAVEQQLCLAPVAPCQPCLELRICSSWTVS